MAALTIDLPDSLKLKRSWSNLLYHSMVRVPIWKCQPCCNLAARLAFSYGWLQHPCKVVARLLQPCTTLCGGCTTFMQGGSNLVARLLPSCHSFNPMVWATLQQPCSKVGISRWVASGNQKRKMKTRAFKKGVAL